MENQGIDMERVLPKGLGLSAEQEKKQERDQRVRAFETFQRATEIIVKGEEAGLGFFGLGKNKVGIEVKTEWADKANEALKKLYPGVKEEEFLRVDEIQLIRWEQSGVDEQVGEYLELMKRLLIDNTRALGDGEMRRLAGLRNDLGIRDGEKTFRFDLIGQRQS